MDKNNVRLIDANAVSKTLRNLPFGYTKSFAGQVALKEIENAPTVEVAPMVRGTWVEVKPRGWHTKGFYETAMIACSECHNVPVPHVESSHEHGGTVTSYRWLKTKHCPNCGAKMDAKEVEGDGQEGS